MFEFMKVLGLVYFWGWFIWPFIFVISLVNAISLKLKDENGKAYIKSIILASISLLIILAGVVAPNFH